MERQRQSKRRSVEDIPSSSKKPRLRDDERESEQPGNSSTRKKLRGDQSIESLGFTRRKINRPSLLKQLQSILSRYPNDSQILREMVQNAEDAGATCMKIIYDNRHIDPGGMSFIGGYFKFPGIWLYNDARFTKEDWEGIITIYSSVKETNTLQVGRFGLGFKSVFHLTDNPVIISGDTLLIIDPIKSETDGDECCLSITLKEFNKKHHDTDKLSKIIFLVNKCNFKDVLKKGQYDGTLFWLPLRQRPSKLCSTVYTDNKANSLLSSFSKEASSILLFLRSMEKIELYTNNDDMPNFTIHVQGTDKHEGLNARTKFNDELKKLGNGLPPRSIKGRYEILMKTTNTKHRYAIVQCLKGLDTLPGEIKSLAATKSPFTGIAYCTDSFGHRKPQGHAFCFLPLPQQEKSTTGLPVHVNGFFELEDNRRYIKFAASNMESEQKDKELLWNDCMIKHLIPETYILLIHLLREKCEKEGNSKELVSGFYQSIPYPKNIESNWQPLLKPLYEKLFGEASFYTEQGDGKWITYTESLFSIFQEDVFDSKHIQSTINKFLLDCGKNLVELPSHIVAVLEYMKKDVEPISPKVVRSLLKKAKLWLNYSDTMKLELLSFVLQDKQYSDLEGIQLLPLNDNTFTSFSNNIKESVFVMKKDSNKLFPGMARQFLSKGRVKDHSHIWESFEEMATKEKKGIFQLKVLGNDDLPGVLEETLDINCVKKDVCCIPKPSSGINKKWIIDIWKEIHCRRYINLDQFNSVSLIPLEINPVMKHGQKSQERKTELELLPLKGNYMLKAVTTSNRSMEAMEKIVQLLGTRIISRHQLILPADFFEHYIYKHTDETIRECLQKASLSTNLQELASKINDTCNENERCYLNDFLDRWPLPIPNVAHFLLKMLRIFRESDNVNPLKMVSFNENSIAIANSHFEFPKGVLYPGKFLLSKHSRLVIELGGMELEENKCISKTLDLMVNEKSQYSIDDRVKLMAHLQDRPKVLKHVLQKAKDLVFMKATHGKRVRVRDLFNNSSELLQALFYGDKDIFPDDNFLKQNSFSMDFIRNLGLKTKDHISDEDLIRVAKCIDENMLPPDKLMLKSRALQQCLITKNPTSNVLEKLKDLKWVICSFKVQGYPKNLKWFHGSQNAFYSPNAVKDLSFSDLIGSVVPLVNVEGSFENIAKHYSWSTPPDPEDILKHFDNVAKSYTWKEHSAYMLMCKEIWTYIDEIIRSKKDVGTFILDKLRCLKCVPTIDHGLNYVEFVVFEFGNLIQFKMDPYVYELANEVKDHHNTFMAMGMRKKVDLELMKLLLERLYKKYTETRDFNLNEVKHDRKLAINILTSIVEMHIDHSQMKKLFIPIESGKDNAGLHFKTADECTYTTLKDSSIFSNTLMKNMNTDDKALAQKIHFVHHDLNHLAPALGIVSLRKRFMFKENATVLPWGQHQPLTARIAELLDEYEDGFVVLKELVQNADDAGARKVHVLYDERQNNDCKDGLLLDDGMAECHGPSIWVYNDAIFQEKDFCNLIKLGGETKLNDAATIGKFGLGFCSVYNVTDVPSLISGKSFVVLDPHVYHLGDAAIDNNPGIRLTLTNNVLQVMPNQFKPYNNVFGCSLTECAKTGYNGTLFRFPLRTHQQAERSKIKSSPYTKREVKELLQKFLADAANLLLFTQNVSEIAVYHLAEQGNNPNKEKTLLFKTFKSGEIISGSSRSSFLLEVANAMTKKTIKQIKPILQVVDVEIEVKKSVRKLLPRIPPSDTTCKCSWIISWGAGNDSYELATKLEKYGAVPVGAVAVPIQKTKCEFIKFLPLKELPKGFYTDGHIFCFLPLSLQTQLPLHINGCFLVDKARKGLQRFDTDNLVNEKCNWNEAMLSDIIKNAYINLLSCVALRTNDAITTTNYWTLWPKSSMNPSEDVRSLVQAFYQSILCTDARVFYRPGFGCALSEALFLSPVFKNSKETGQIAYNFLNAVHEGDSTIMDLPLDTYRSFQDFGGENIEKLNNRIISKFTFFKKYFFPMINNQYWRQPSMMGKRNKLIMEALNDVEMHDLVKNATCIPVECVDILRKPADLVLKTGSICDMFHGNDGRFITQEFLRYTETLCKLGMMIDKIPSTLLIERAQSVQSGNKKQSLLRSHAILKYLNGSIQNHIDILDELKKIKFLPFMVKPRDWPLSWKGKTNQSEIFLSPSSLFSPLDKTIVGSVGYILDTMGNTYSEVFLRKIGIRNVQIEDVVEQMKVLINANLISSVGLENLCERLYDRLDKALETPSELLNFLKKCWNKRIISVKENMIEPSKVAFSVLGDCKPFLYKMPTKFAKYKRLWSFIGVEDKFDKKTLLCVLYDLSRFTKQMSQKKTLSIVDVLRNLSNRLQSDGAILTEERSNLYIPDIDCRMRHIDRVCFEDGQFDYDEDAYIIHGEITEQVKKDLGIMSKRQLFLIRNGCPLPFGQNEPLVTRLKGIINAYPRDHSVLNELLQNADDAGASEVHFVYDLRQHGTEHILDDRCKFLQGPALCVFNDSCFSDADIKGIQSLGEGSKRNDRTKTGQFGVGFNAVYHLTDAPSFLTKGPTTPDKGAVCIFDPHCWYLPRFATPTSPGMMLTLEKFKSKYRDSYCGYLQDILPADVGTWFRLPLRTENENFKSEISDHCILGTDMNDLLQKMKQQMSTSLLFLSSVQKISISCIEPNEPKLSKTFSVNLSMCEEDRHNFKTFASHMRKEFKMLKNKRKKINEMTFKEITYTAKLNDNSGNDDIWLLCQTFGFKDENLIPQVVVQASDNGELGFLPKGGTAFKYNVETTHGLRREDGTAFCSLPLPIFTGLPCHINGHFSLHSDRSQIFCGKNKDDERYIWNKLLFKEVVAHSYASCIEYAKHTLPRLMMENSTIEYLNVFFECFPAICAVSSDILKDYVFEIFLNIATRELQVFPVYPEYTNYIQEMLPDGMGAAFTKQIRWVPLKCQGDSFTALFDDISSNYKYSAEKQKLDIVSGSRIENTRETVHPDVHIVRTVFVDLSMKLICTPLWIYNSMADACQSHHNQNENNDTKEHTSEDCIPLAKCSPNVAVLFLKSWISNSIDNVNVNIPLDKSIFKTIKRVRCILDYCFKQTGVKPCNLSDLPLLVSNAGYLLRISGDKNLIMSEFCDLFPEFGSRFVHKSLIQTFRRFEVLFHKLSIELFVSFLGKAIDLHMYKTTEPVKWDIMQTKGPNYIWITAVWKYLEQVENDQLIIALSDWCLFPSVWFKKEPMLLSIHQAFAVVDYKSFSSSNQADRSLGRIFERLALPCISEYNQASCHLPYLVASRKTPDKLVKCLIYHKDHIQHHNLSIEECDTILEFFDKNIGSIDWHAMKCLRLFTTIDNRIVDINKSDQILVLRIENEAVLQGLNELAEERNTVLLRHNACHTHMYKALNMSLCLKQDDESPLMEFYVSFVLPHYEFLPENTRIVHLQYVRDKLLKFKSQKLETSLKNLHFVSKSREKGLHRACEFFSPHYSIFAKLCSESELPPSPFNQLEWKEFMNVAGIKTQVTHDQFIVFACHIELQGLNEKSRAQSKELIKHLLTMSIHDLTTAFIDKIRNIKFIVPFLVDRKYALISPQKATNTLIAFSGSVQEKNFRIAWTTHNIISDDDMPPNGKGLLNDNKTPTTESIVRHLGNVCNSLQKGILKDEPIFVTDLMTQIYRYLLSISKCETLFEKLKEIPIVHIIESYLFLPATNVFLKEQTISEIKPYLMLGSEKYGEFFDLFRRIGASDQITLDNYIRVLASVKKTVGSSQLAIEERECTEKAVRGLLKLLQFNTNPPVATVTETVCYLLDEGGELFPSNILVFADDNALKQRLKHQTEIKFLFSTDQFKSDGFDVDKCLSMLPENLRPRKLSTMVEEELISSNFIKWKVADILESFVSSDVFVHCIIRLVKSANDTEILSLKISNEITLNLRSIKVVALETLQTILKIDNVQIESSCKNKPVFHLKSENTIYIASGDYDELKWIAKFHHHVACVIHELCFKKPEIKHIQTILSNYNSTEDELFAILDDLGIVPLEYKPTDKFWTPSLGTPVPKDCLKFLVHDLVQFSPGDYAVLEVFDDLLDDDANKGNSSGQLIYVYVKVINCLSDNQEQFPFYLIDTGEGRTREVRSTELYKIVRRDLKVEVQHELQVELYCGTKEKCTDEENDKEKIFQEIEEALIDAWKLGQKDFKRVFRRLLLRWHPDKNKNSEFYNEVTKHIMTIVKRLENGEINTDKVPTFKQRYQNRRRNHFKDYRRQWNDNIGRTGKAHGDRTEPTFDAEDFAERVRRQYRSWNDAAYSSDECRSDPQPDMAKVWLRQAKSDLKAAESLLRVATAETFNWVCVTSHQAAEKALKAIQVAKDGVESRSHSLLITAALGNTTLKQAALQLEARVGDYTKMRYPRPVFYPNAPCDLYDRTDAEETVRLAKIIVETVGKIIK